MFLLLVSFIAGGLTVLAPCILPLLPIIVGGSLTGGRINKLKVLTVITALGASVILFTLLLKATTTLIDIPEYVWKLVSGSIVIFFGLVMLFPRIWENSLIASFAAKSNIALGRGEQKKSFWGDVTVGAALGPIFSTCSPTYFVVLATVLPANPVLGFIYLLAYTTGLCLSLLLIVLVGQKIISGLGIAASPGSLFKKIIGLVFILVGLAILTGYDKKLEANILESGFFDITKLERRLLEEK